MNSKENCRINALNLFIAPNLPCCIRNSPGPHSFECLHATMRRGLRGENRARYHLPQVPPGSRGIVCEGSLTIRHPPSSCAAMSMTGRLLTPSRHFPHGIWWGLVFPAQRQGPSLYRDEHGVVHSRSAAADSKRCVSLFLFPSLLVRRRAVFQNAPLNSRRGVVFRA